MIIFPLQNLPVGHTFLPLNLMYKSSEPDVCVFMKSRACVATPLPAAAEAAIAGSVTGAAAPAAASADPPDKTVAPAANVAGPSTAMEVF